jgi:DtxR family manganese transport transcriptional regulator
MRLRGARFCVARRRRLHATGQAVSLEEKPVVAGVELQARNAGRAHPGAPLRSGARGPLGLIAAHGEARATEVAKRLGVAHPTALKCIARLKREGLATSRPYRGVFLTDAGAALAEKVRARHRLIVDTLCAIGVPPEAAEADAEGMEHHASEATLAAFARFLKARE